MRFAQSRGYLLGREWSEFARQYPQWRVALKRICTAKLRDAEKEFRKIESEYVAQARVDGFTREDVENDARLKRLRRRVIIWRGLLDDVGTEQDGERLWMSILRNLREDS
jgi:hypothetical protein